jgi:hypothetical protein
MKIFLIISIVIIISIAAVYVYFTRNYPSGYFVQNDKVMYGEWIAGGHRIVNTELDPKTWKDLGNSYARDNKIVVFSSHTLPNADVETFERIKVDRAEVQDYYSRDKNFLYAGSGIVRDIDPNTVEFWPGEYIKDRNAVYYKYKAIPDVDVETARALSKKNETVLIDKNSVYIFGRKVEGADPTSFEIIHDGSYSTDKPYYKDRNRYYDGTGKPVNPQ